MIPIICCVLIILVQPILSESSLQSSSKTLMLSKIFSLFPPIALSFKSVSSSSIPLENDNYYASLKPKFEEFNELFLSKTVISIPQQSISIIGDDYDEISDDNERPYSYLNVTNFECFEFRVGNIQDRIQKINRRRTRYILNIVDLTVTCNMNWLYVRGSKVEDYGSARLVYQIMIFIEIVYLLEL